jgi:7,8-dihydropterin-6-yl-methyl-4-(beta-D-ribofuranosyl)aminobenzene 5'-phosphate synthase
MANIINLVELKIIVLIIILLVFFYYLNETKMVTMVDNETSSNLTIVIIYDNNEYDEKMEMGFGFSCLVKLENKNILFDTGGDSPTLLNNMNKLKIDPKEIDTIVLSHIHGDHVGGLSGFLEVNPNVKVYIPQSFPKSFKDEIKSYGASFADVSDSTKIFDGIYSTGELGTWIKEQSLIIKTEKGLVVITGCAHPGIVDIVKRSKELMKEDVYLVTGGFHLGGAGDYEIKNIIESFRNIGVKKVAPCHCTGDRAISLFEEEYKNDFIKAGVGKTILV